MPDLATRDDLEALLRAFYRRAFADPLLGHVFVDVVQMDLEEHLPRITVPTVFTHGTADPFGTIDELRPAAGLVAADTEVVEVTGARHDLGSKKLDVPALAVDAALRLLR